MRASVAALRTALLDYASQMLEEEPTLLECMHGHVFSRLNSVKRISLAELVKEGFTGRFTGKKLAEISALDPETGEGVPYETYAFGVQMAEIELNLKSGEVKVLRVVAAHDSGTPINPIQMEGQIEGGIVMGMGYALSEEFIPEQTVDFGRYRIPRAKDSPEIIPIFVNVPRSGGPYGATGVAEPALVPTAPAIINAISQACGIRIYSWPANKKKIKAAIKTPAV